MGLAAAGFLVVTAAVAVACLASVMHCKWKPKYFTVCSSKIGHTVQRLCCSCNGPHCGQKCTCKRWHSCCMMYAAAAAPASRLQGTKSCMALMSCTMQVRDCNGQRGT